MDASFTFFVTAPRGMESLLADELRGMGAPEAAEGRGGVTFRGNLALGYRACLWSRVASRVLLSLARFPAETPDALYAGVRSMQWEEHLRPEGSLAVDLISSASAIAHTHYGALKVKDAIVDRFRDASGVRPSVNLDRPDIRVNVYLFQNEARVSLDLSGDSLHRRGYREAGAAAPLKENLAAAILLRARWPEIAASGGPLLDPMCGSGTLPIEAALIAGDVAPGLLRSHFGFTGWRGHSEKAWRELLKEARSRRAEGQSRIPPIAGCDRDPAAVGIALENVRRAGLHGQVHIERRPLEKIQPAHSETPGLVVLNPPYGERMGREKELVALYAQLGDALRANFPGWRAAVFTGNPGLASHIQLRPRRSYSLFNGPIPCKLLVYKLASTEKVQERAQKKARPGTATEKSPGAEMLANRLRKNLRHFGRWARRAGVSCYRLYGGDLPEYPLIVDLYRGDEKLWAHVQAYAPPASVDPDKAAARRKEALAALPRILEIPVEQIFFKERQRQKGKNQYEKQGSGGRFYQVPEGDCRFRVNFTDYLDTGLFLDHRITRQKIREKADGRRFLNLFGYTGTATVYAAMGGAISTTTVDMSRTYLEWARQNMELNGFGEDGHDMVQADCLLWLAREIRERRKRYGLIFLDPPTFSNSKRMAGTFDVQRDHAGVIAKTVQLLEPGGILLFSTNRRNFRMAFEGKPGFKITDITKATIPPDFARNPRVHCCWEIVREKV